MFLLTTIASLAAYFVSCLAAGALALRLALSPGRGGGSYSTAASLASAYLLGQGVLGALWLFLALAGWFSPWAAGGSMALALLLGWTCLRDLLRPMGSSLRAIWEDLKRQKWAERIAIVLVLVICLLGLSTVGYPIEGDGAAGYLVRPKIIAASHTVGSSLREAGSPLGLHGEMNYAAVMSIGNGEAARLVGWGNLLALLLLLWALCARLGLGRKGQWTALALVCSSSAIMMSLGDGKVDLFGLPLGLAACYWVLAPRVRGRLRALATAGVFTGFAVVAKLSYLVALLPTIGLLVLWQAIYLPAPQSVPGGAARRASLGDTVKTILVSSLVLGLWAAVALAPHLCKNYVLFSNVLAMDGSASQSWFTAETTRKILLSYPFSLTFGQFWAQYGQISPLLLLLAPLGLALPRPRPFLGSPLVAAGLAGLAGLAAWVILYPSVFAPRYFMPGLVLLFPFAAKAMEHVLDSEQRPRILSLAARVCLVLVLLNALWFFLFYANPGYQRFYPLRSAKLLLDRMDQCQRDGAICEAIEAINRDAPQGSRVMVATWYKYWLRPDLLQCRTFPVWTLSEQMEKSGEGAWPILAKAGVDYLLLDYTTHEPTAKLLLLDDLPAWVRLIPMYESGMLKVFKVEFVNSPYQRQKCCRRAGRAAWKVFDH